jgi:diguanylate cyclase (GGDEF)-like protein
MTERAPDARDHAADERDRIADERDQIADQRDQAADERDADGTRRDRDAATASIKSELADYSRAVIADDEGLRGPKDRADSAEIRELSALDREMNAADRAEAAEDYRSHADPDYTKAKERDRQALKRDQAAELRDVRRSSRDDTANELDRAFAANTSQARRRRFTERESASLNRSQAADDRFRSAADRSESAGDRNVSVEDRRTAEDERDLTTTRHLGQMATALEETTELTWQTLHDPLTGLLNRTGFEAEVTKPVVTNPAGNSTTSLMFCDIDYFKVVNDKYGHAAGDTVLKEVAARLTGSVRSHDLVARIGGDEFIVVISNEPAPIDVTRIAEKIRTAMNEDLVIGTQHLTITMSVGIATGTTSPITQLIADADEALLEAKAAGRDRIATFVRDQ